MTSDMWLFPGDDPMWGHVDMTGYKVVAVDGDVGTVESSLPKAGAACIVVKSAPEYDPSRADDSGYRDEVGRHYSA